MPGQDVAEINDYKNYYNVKSHAYGSNEIYHNDEDYNYFLSLLNKFIINNNSVDLSAYCLKPHYFDLLLFQISKDGVLKLMHNIVSSLNQYYYEKYNIEDILSESNYRVSIVPESDLLKTSRNIHLQSDGWIDYPYSSIRAYLYDDTPDWLNKTHLSDKYVTTLKYFDFLGDTSNN